ncbi:MAG: alpha/beta hydrolase family protein, partial [Nannocystaceae bacterium]
MSDTTRRTRSLSMNRRAMMVLGLAALAGCTAPDLAPPAALDGPGQFGVARTRLALDVSGRGVPVEVWYPTKDVVDDPAALATLALDEDRAAQWTAWLSDAPAECVRGETLAAADAEPVRGGFPLIVMSHCHECSRLGAVQIAETLTAHGFVVAAPDHVGGDLFSALDGTSTGFTPTTLATRVEDVHAVIDELLGGEGLPPATASLLEGVISPAGVGLLGHSFGVTTINTVHLNDARVDALMGLAGPLDVFGGAPAVDVDAPLLTLRAIEDNTIGTLGNDLIRSQFDEVSSDKWFIDVLDAGHYSFLNICGMLDQFG